MTTRRFPAFSIAASLFASGCIVAMPALAIDQFAKGERPTIARAFDLIHKPSTTVPVGTSLVFKRKDSPGAKLLAAKGFQIRTFAVADAQTIPEALYSMDDCDIYLSSLTHIKGTTGEDIKFADMDAGWLDVSDSTNSVQPAHFFIVFEMPNANDAVFRLKKADRANYFKQGFHISVSPGDKDILREVQARFQRRKDTLTELVKRVTVKSSAIPCYEFKEQRLWALQEPDIETRTLVACDAGTKPSQPEIGSNASIMAGS
jgi:hypothetical protein